MLAQKSYKPIVIFVNKWDLVEATGPWAQEQGKIVDTESTEDYLRKEFKGIEFAPISPSGAPARARTSSATIQIAFNLHTQAISRVSTGKLNRLLKEVLATRRPIQQAGHLRQGVLYRAGRGRSADDRARVNRPTLFTPNYKRFLVNRIRESVPYSEVPISSW